MILQPFHNWSPPCIPVQNKDIGLRFTNISTGCSVCKKRFYTYICTPKRSNHIENDSLLAGWWCVCFFFFKGSLYLSINRLNGLNCLNFWSWTSLQRICLYPMHSYAPTYQYIYIHTYIYVNTYAYEYIQIYIHIYIHIYIYIYICIYIYIYVFKYTYAYIYIHTYIYIYLHISM